MDNSTDYLVPKSLTVLSGVFLALGICLAVLIAFDMVLRRAWWSTMPIMIPVYIITATYLGPLTLFLYYRHGRPIRPDSKQANTPYHSEQSRLGKERSDDVLNNRSTLTKGCGTESDAQTREKNSNQSTDSTRGMAKQERTTGSNAIASPHSGMTEGIADGNRTCCNQNSPVDVEATMPAHHTKASARPYWVTVLIGVSHCGAGCVLGDLVGEWLVYGANPTISGRSIWPELLIDYAFALFFGIFFQYFSIAPMSGHWGLMTLTRAVKADIISLTSFEIGTFGWMVAYQVGIFGYRFEMTTWLYWWMMQIAMMFGTATAFPVNWWLLNARIKEPCC